MDNRSSAALALFCSLACSSGAQDFPVKTKADKEAFEVESKTEPKLRNARARAPKEADAGGSDLDRDPCYRIEPRVESRWASAGEYLESGAARWNRWYRPAEGDEACELEVIALDQDSALAEDGDCKIACSDTGFIGLRVDNEAIIEGPNCEGKQLLLIDVLTHEIGHHFGFTHGSEGAMGPHAWCEPVVPSTDEVF